MDTYENKTCIRFRPREEADEKLHSCDQLNGRMPVGGGKRETRSPDAQSTISQMHLPGYYIARVDARHRIRAPTHELQS